MSALVAEVLLKAGADVRATNRHGRTALEEVMTYGSSYKQELIWLLEKWERKARKNEEKEAGTSLLNSARSRPWQTA